YNCHINGEACITVKSVKYIFKYINCDGHTHWIHSTELDRTRVLVCDGLAICMHSIKPDGACALDCDQLTHWIHSTKLDRTRALSSAACTTRLCVLHWFKNIINIYQ
ncbi:hypothetical protein AeNC1_019188, partial [Aphanomyces euteiches]